MCIVEVNKMLIRYPEDLEKNALEAYDSRASQNRKNNYFTINIKLQDKQKDKEKKQLEAIYVIIDNEYVEESLK